MSDGNGALPDGWKKSTIGEIASLITKGSSPKWQGFDYADSGVLFIRSQNVRWGSLDLEDVQCLPKGFREKHRSSTIKVGDVLLNLVGASVGRAAIATDDLDDSNCNQAVGIIRLAESGVIKDYLLRFLLSPEAQRHIHGTKVDVARP